MYRIAARTCSTGRERSRLRSRPRKKEAPRSRRQSSINEYRIILEYRERREAACPSRIAFPRDSVIGRRLLRIMPLLIVVYRQRSRPRTNRGHRVAGDTIRRRKLSSFFNCYLVMRRAAVIRFVRISTRNSEKRRHSTN